MQATETEAVSALTVRNLTRRSSFIIVAYMQSNWLSPSQAPWFLVQFLSSSLSSA